VNISQLKELKGHFIDQNFHFSACVCFCFLERTLI